MYSNLSLSLYLSLSVSLSLSLSLPGVSHAIPRFIKMGDYDS